MKTKNFIKTVLLKIFGGLFNELIEEKIKSLTDEVSKMKEMLTPQKVKSITDPSLHEFPDKGLTIRSLRTSTNSKDSKDFSTSLPCWKEGATEFKVIYPFSGKIKVTGGAGYYDTSHGISESLRNFLNLLFKTDVVTQINVDNPFEFTITKSRASSWEEVTPKVLEAIVSHFEDVSKEEESIEVETVTAEV